MHSMTASPAPADFMTLPDDVIFMVLDYIPHLYFPALASMCRRLHDLVIPGLYRSIYYQGCRFDKYGGPRRYLGTKALNISKLASSLAASPSNASLIKDLSLEWRAHERGRDVDMKKLFEISLPSLESLHTTWILPSILSSSITSLVIDVSHVDSNLPRHPTGTNWTELFEVFSLPRLLQLTLIGSRSWDMVSSIELDKMYANRVSSSTIRSLSIYGFVPSSSNLKELFSWPKQLESLTICADCEDDALWESLSNQSPQIFIAQLVRSIEVFSSTLEGLFISGRSFYFDRLANLTMFPALRMIGLPLAFFMDARLMDASMDFSDVFPPSLESLQIELPNNLAEWDGYNYGNQTDAVPIWLSELARKKGIHYPKLRKLLWWYPKPGSWRDPEEVMELDMEIFIDVFEEAGIDVHTARTYKDTLFAITDTSYVREKGEAQEKDDDEDVVRTPLV